MHTHHQMHLHQSTMCGAPHAHNFKNIKRQFKKFTSLRWMMTFVLWLVIWGRVFRDPSPTSEKQVQATESRLKPSFDPPTSAPLLTSIYHHHFQLAVRARMTHFVLLRPSFYYAFLSKALQCIVVIPISTTKKMCFGKRTKNAGNTTTNVLIDVDKHYINKVLQCLMKTNIGKNNFYQCFRMSV